MSDAMEQAKLQLLTSEEGFDHFVDMIEAYQDESCVPGICMNPNCDATYHYEPDSTTGYCDVCKTNTVKSCFILAGIM